MHTFAKLHVNATPVNSKKFLIDKLYDIQQVMWSKTFMHFRGRWNRTIARRSVRKKRYRWIALILVLVGTGYWMKCRLGINFFRWVSVSSYFPMNYLANDILSAKHPGVIIDEDFDHFRLFGNWSYSAMRRNKGLLVRVGENGFGASGCLLITSDEERRWACPYAKVISASTGDTFRFDGLVYLEDNSKLARLCVASFDQDRKAIDWKMAAQGVEKTGAWVRVWKQFTITDDRVRFIRFRLSGGRGGYRFDNLMLSKLKSSQPPNGSRH